VCQRQDREFGALPATETDDLDHAREVDGAIVNWLNANGSKAGFCFLADRGIVGNGHMPMLEDNSDAIAGVILDWLDGAGGAAPAVTESGKRVQGTCAASPRNK
jgi:hypothetical protein